MVLRPKASAKKARQAQTARSKAPIKRKQKRAAGGAKIVAAKKEPPTKRGASSRARKAPSRTASTPLLPPKGGAAIRMYRIGHGDCFLLAFPAETAARPVYVLIDCGYKPGSPGKLKAPTTAKDIAADILATTGGTVDIAVVTHEHQDHLNGFTGDNFSGLKVGQVWFAWTENGSDEIANKLRRRFNDRLLKLIDRKNNIALSGSSQEIALEKFLELELGEEAEGFNGHMPFSAAGGKDPAASGNKKAMKFLRDCAKTDPEYLYPHEKPRVVPGAKSARAFVLGPPRDPAKIDDLDPEGDERFFGIGNGAAAGGLLEGTQGRLFSAQHALALDDLALQTDGFFSEYYGFDQVADAEDAMPAPSNAAWRRLTADDAAEAATLALAMNNATNNSSLVLAFEVSRGGKVLLFAADAQAGNWRSWADRDFEDGSKTISVADLLERTVVYKVGHHGSHNATLKGVPDTKKPSLHSMAKGRHGNEFVAMITAVEKWAHQKPKPDWEHPLPAIKTALLEKAEGRVLQTDESIQDKPSASGARNWKDFMKRVTETPLYFDLIVEP